jgi:hypothetical protein
MGNEQKTKWFLGAVVACLAIIAILGYALEAKKEPVRVAFDTKGGGVIFNHQLHVNLKDVKCQECHHNYEPGAEKTGQEMNCRNCHFSKEFQGMCDDEAIHKQCIGKNCIDCHTAGSVECDFCHNAESFKQVEEPKQVKFETDAGTVVFDHFLHASADGLELSCDSCHHGYKPEEKKSAAMSCGRCHYNQKYKSLCETEDAENHINCISRNCMECHSDSMEDCEMCHKDE